MIPFLPILSSFHTLRAGADGCASKSVPDFVLAMSQTIWYAEIGFFSSKTDPAYKFPATLCGLFHLHKNYTSDFLHTFYCLLLEVALGGTSHIKYTDPVHGAFFLGHGSFKSERD